VGAILGVDGLPLPVRYVVEHAGVLGEQIEGCQMEYFQTKSTYPFGMLLYYMAIWSIFGLYLVYFMVGIFCGQN
jgi:hypothetical protein